MLTQAKIVERSSDIARINAIANDPAVRPFVGPGVDPLDLTPVIENPDNVTLIGEHGGFLMCWSSPATFEVHTFVTLGGRGSWARSAAASTIRQMRERGARRLWTRIAPEMTNVIAFAEEMGMRQTGETAQSFGRPYLVFEMAL